MTGYQESSFERVNIPVFHPTDQTHAEEAIVIELFEAEVTNPKHQHPGFRIQEIARLLSP